MEMTKALLEKFWTTYSKKKLT